MRVYLVGRLSARGPDGAITIDPACVEAFDRAKVEWGLAGHCVVSPADIARSIGCQPKDAHTDACYRAGMSRCLAALFGCDAVALVPGWEESPGGSAELALALALKIPVWDAVLMVPINPTPVPWLALLNEAAETGRLLAKLNQLKINAAISEANTDLAAAVKEGA